MKDKQPNDTRVTQNGSFLVRVPRPFPSSREIADEGARGVDAFIAESQSSLAKCTNVESCMVVAQVVQQLWRCFIEHCRRC